MKILAFDTCLDKMYVAISEDAKLLDSKIVETTQSHYHSAFLISTIKKILKENALKPQDIDAVATNIGPGSFTGIRACTTVARLFAQQLCKKAIGVSSLEVLSKINSENKKTLVALDARKEMAYTAIYENGKQIQAPKAVLIEELKETLSSMDYSIITDDKLETILGGTSYQKCDDDLGKYLIEIAFEKLNEGVDTDWKNLLPLYIQPPALHVKNTK